MCNLWLETVIICLKWISHLRLFWMYIPRSLADVICSIVDIAGGRDLGLALLSRAVNETPCHSNNMSLATWDHTVLPATWHKWTHPALTPARQAGAQFTYPRGMEGWVYLGGWEHTETGTDPSTNPTGSQTCDLLITSPMPEPLN